jgi:hypothetical protein
MADILKLGLQRCIGKNETNTIQSLCLNATNWVLNIQLKHNYLYGLFNIETYT